MPDKRREVWQLLSRFCRSQAMLLLLGICLGFIMGSNIWHDRRSSLVRNHPGAVTACADDLTLADNALVVYSFYDGDEVSWGNLLFFLDQAMSPSDGAQYVIVLNGMSTLHDPRLPRLPSNAQYVLHENECYDWGTYTWVLEKVVDPSRFKCVLSALHALPVLIAHNLGCVGTNAIMPKAPPEAPINTPTSVLQIFYLSTVRSEDHSCPGMHLLGTGHVYSHRN